jgi:hypothetical protein
MLLVLRLEVATIVQSSVPNLSPHATMELDPRDPLVLPNALPQPAELPATNHIVLDVSGSNICTRKFTLQTSPYFEHMLSGRWNVDLLPDGSLPIHADPDIFSVLLGYMRRPAVYPLFWTEEQGFDYVTHNKLMAEADFFGLDDLETWILERRYLKAVKEHLTMTFYEGRLVKGGTYLSPRNVTAENNDHELLYCLEVKGHTQERTSYSDLQGAVVTVMRYREYCPESCQKK